MSEAWKEMPSLNVGRQSHASCATQGTVFVFCGFSAADEALSSLEMLHTKQSPNRWQFFNISNHDLSPRFGLGVAPINANEIAIIGGFIKNDIDD